MIRRTLLCIVTLLPAVLLIGCGTSEFRGGSISGSSGKGKEATKDPASSEHSGDSTAIAVPVENPDGTIVPVESGTNHDDSQDELGLNESVIFGNDKVYRIGDGVIKGTSCMDNVSAYNLEGTKYNFNFEILKDDTTLQIKIDTLCGVDVDDYNLLYIKNQDGEMQNASLTAGQTSVVLQAIKLNAGSYSFVIESTKIKKGQYKGHFDDFIVGKIHVNSDKEIVPGDVLAD